MRRPMQTDEAHEIYNLFQLCSELHVLPNAGGLNDQDALLVHLFMLILGLERERDAAKKG